MTDSWIPIKLALFGLEAISVVLHYNFVGLNFYLMERSHDRRQEVYHRELRIISSAVLDQMGQDKLIDYFELSMSYNSKHDPDNTIVIPKMVVDACRTNRNIIGDQKTWYKTLMIRPGLELPMNTYCITISQADGIS